MYDVRLVKLASVISSLAGDLALTMDTSPDTLIAEAFYHSADRLISNAEDYEMDKLLGQYPILQSVLD